MSRRRDFGLASSGCIGRGILATSGVPAVELRTYLPDWEDVYDRLMCR
jgi:hypothetical protein